MAGFEERLAQLEAVVAGLERGDLTLEESVRLFEEGMRLSQACKQELEQAEGRMQVLVEGRKGAMQTAGLELEADDEDEAEEEQRS